MKFFRVSEKEKPEFYRVTKESKREVKEFKKLMLKYGRELDRHQNRKTKRKILRQHRTINGYRLCRASVPRFPVIFAKSSLKYVSIPASLLSI